MTSRRSVGPSKTFAQRALAEFPGPVWSFAPQYSEIADVAGRAFPESTEFHIGLGLDWYRFVHSWPERGVLLAITARLLEGGTVKLVDYESVAIPGDVPDAFD